MWERYPLTPTGVSLNRDIGGRFQKCTHRDCHCEQVRKMLADAGVRRNQIRTYMKGVDTSFDDPKEHILIMRQVFEALRDNGQKIVANIRRNIRP